MKTPQGQGSGGRGGGRKRVRGGARLPQGVMLAGLLSPVGIMPDEACWVLWMP